MPAETHATVLLSTSACTVEASCRDESIAGGSPDQVVVVALDGEIDLINADDVHAVLHGLIERLPARIDLELHRLDFIDSFGISRLIMAQMTARAAGVALAIRRARPATRRVFAIAGLLTFLNVD